MNVSGSFPTKTADHDPGTRPKPYGPPWTMLLPGVVLAAVAFLVVAVSALDRDSVHPAAPPLDGRKYAVVVLYGQAPHAGPVGGAPWTYVSACAALAAVGLACAVVAIAIQRVRSASLLGSLPVSRARRLHQGVRRRA